MIIFTLIDLTSLVQFFLNKRLPLAINNNKICTQMAFYTKKNQKKGLQMEPPQVLANLKIRLANYQNT
jgi:hypothetical protein